MNDRTPWIGVDLDGTLAYYKEWGSGKIGEPIPKMVDRIKQWLSEGRKVKIFTARVGYDNSQLPEIHEWLEKVGLPKLEVTATKDWNMVELWDDRCKQVVPNTGETVEELNDKLLLRLSSQGLEDTIYIKKTEYKRLEDREYWLQCLEEAGVDNWCGYDEAGRIYREAMGDEDEM
jgi:hypothetical protein